ncbi:MAG: hypothetical protein ACI9W0_000853 [Gammaproteobacteria bacterium]|jgi:hypothetical protein
MNRIVVNAVSSIYFNYTGYSLTTYDAITF